MGTSVDKAPPQDDVSRVLIWILLTVTAGCWAAMIWATVLTYRQAPPIPDRFLDPASQVLMTREDIVAGKAAFQQADLMDYGSLYGMGSYFGEDYTAEYLVRLARDMRERLAQARYDNAFDQLDPGRQAAVTQRMRRMLRAVDLTAKSVALPAALAGSVRTLRDQIAQALQTDDFEKGWTRAYSLTPHSASQTADFLLYSTLTTVALRPGLDYSWTINWPPEPLVGNAPTAASFTWTWVSFTLVFFGIGAVVAIFRLYIERPGPLETRESALQDFAAPTPSQRALWKYFLLVAAVLLVQIAAGSILAHYYTERTGFYGLAIDRWLPFAWLRSVHLQAPIVWIGLSWIGAALFLAPVIGRREPAGQRHIVNLIFWVLVVIVVGALGGNYLGIMGAIRKHWFWFGNQGLSYLELGRFWQILFFAGLLAWSLALLRAFWPTLLALWRRGHTLYGLFRAEHLLWYSTLGMAVIYAFGMVPLAQPHPSFSITDFWRWWVVHLWVEWAFEQIGRAHV